MPLKIHVRSTAYGQPPVRVFEKVKTLHGERTVVKVIKLDGAAYELIVAKVNWSKYKMINKIKKIFIRVKYR